MELEMKSMTTVTGFAKVIHPYSCSGRKIYLTQSGVRVEQHFNAVPIAALYFPEQKVILS